MKNCDGDSINQNQTRSDIFSFLHHLQCRFKVQVSYVIRKPISSSLLFFRLLYQILVLNCYFFVLLLNHKFCDYWRENANYFSSVQLVVFWYSRFWLAFPLSSCRGFRIRFLSFIFAASVSFFNLTMAVLVCFLLYLTFAVAESCLVTSNTTEGPYYKPGAPYRNATICEWERYSFVEWKNYKITFWKSKFSAIRTRVNCSCTVACSIRTAELL